MNYEKMWNRLKFEVVEKSNRVGPGNTRRVDYNDVLLTMSSIEAEEYEKAEKAGNREFAVQQEIIRNVDIKSPNLEKVAKEMFEQITGYKVIDSLEKLESEIQRRRGKFSNYEKIVVDEKVDIPMDIWDEANVHGIVIARFGIDVISSDAMPKGIFVHKVPGV